MISPIEKTQFVDIRPETSEVKTELKKVRVHHAHIEMIEALMQINPELQGVSLRENPYKTFQIVSQLLASKGLKAPVETPEAFSNWSKKLKPIS